MFVLYGTVGMYYKMGTYLNFSLDYHLVAILFAVWFFSINKHVNVLIQNKGFPLKMDKALAMVYFTAGESG